MSETMSEPTSTVGLALYQQNYESNINKTIGNISRTTYKSIIYLTKTFLWSTIRKAVRKLDIDKIIYGKAKIRRSRYRC